MKTKIWTIIIVGLLITISSCKEDLNKHLTLILQPDSLTGQDANIKLWGSEINYGKEVWLSLYKYYSANTQTQVVTRFVINFDLSSIPDNAIIDSAFLSLSSPQNSIDCGDDFFIYRIISPWDESTITWDTQPTVTIMDYIMMPKSKQIQVFSHIDVTTLVQDMINDKENSYGFSFRFCFESGCGNIYFGSSNNAEESIRPKIVIYYTL